MTSQEQNIFYSIIRTSVASPDAYDQVHYEMVKIIPDHFIWDTLIRAFEDHAILGIVAHTISTLPEEKQPTPSQMESICLYVANLRRAHWITQQTIHQLCTELEEQEIHPILLKGEGLAAIYPETSVRSCGDIDIYVDEPDFQKACAIADSIDATHSGNGNYYEDDLHYRTSLNGITIEIHRHPAETSVKRLNDDFNHWAREQLTPDRCERIHIDKDNTILIPPQPYNTLFVFDHLCKHLLNDGSALRQLLDWLYLIRQLRETDTEELRNNLNRFHLLRPWQVLSGILYHQFAIPQKEIPFFNQKIAQLSQGRLLNQITQTGNFGQNATPHRQHTGIQRTHGAFSFYRNRYKTNKILFPADAASICFFYLFKGMKNRMPSIK